MPGGVVKPDLPVIRADGEAIIGTEGDRAHAVGVIVILGEKLAAAVIEPHAGGLGETDGEALAARRISDVHDRGWQVRQAPDHRLPLDIEEIDREARAE